MTQKKHPPMADKSARKSATGKPFTRGRDGRRGRGPKKGAPNAGRPPLTFAQECGGLQRGVIFARCQKVLTDRKLGPGDPKWEWAANYVSRYGAPEAVKEIDILDRREPLLNAPLRDRVAAVRAMLGA